jgi:hypothetical protein
MTYPREPDLVPTGDRLRERTQPLAPDDARYGFAHAYLCQALGVAFQQAQEVADPEGDVPPLAPILDPGLAPDWALPWVAQLVGVRLPANIGPDEARVLITEARGFKRGTRESIYAAASYWLTGDKTMYFRERDAGDPYALEVVTLDSETPDPEAVRDALIAQKPAGLILRYRQVTGWDYEELTLTGDTYAVVATDFATYATLTANEPS